MSSLLVLLFYHKSGSFSISTLSRYRRDSQSTKSKLSMT